MRALILSLLVGFVSFTASANDTQETECDTPIFYQPGGSTLKDSASTFNIQLEVFINRCDVQSKLPKGGKLNYAIRSFTQGSGSKTLVYEVTDFAVTLKPTSSICTLTETSKFVKQPFPGMGYYESEISLSCTEPKCTKNQSVHCSDEK